MITIHFLKIASTKTKHMQKDQNTSQYIQQVYFQYWDNGFIWIHFIIIHQIKHFITSWCLSFNPGEKYARQIDNLFPNFQGENKHMDETTNHLK